MLASPAHMPHSARHGSTERHDQRQRLINFDMNSWLEWRSSCRLQSQRQHLRAGVPRRRSQSRWTVTQPARAEAPTRNRPWFPEHNSSTKDRHPEGSLARLCAKRSGRIAVALRLMPCASIHHSRNRSGCCIHLVGFVRMHWRQNCAVCSRIDSSRRVIRRAKRTSRIVPAAGRSRSTLTFTHSWNAGHGT